MKILVLAGGSDQKALINELKKRGHEVILVDYFDCPPAKIIADKHYIASTLDVGQVRRIALEERVELITTACTDQALLTVSLVSEQLGLPFYLSYATALSVTNKSYMKKVFSKWGIPTAEYKVFSDAVIDVSCDLSFPLVVKPADCNSSKGVKRLDCPDDDLRGSIVDAINLSRSKAAIVEEFKKGVEISADYYINGEKVVLLSVTSSSKINNTDSFTIICSNYPAVSESQEAKILDIGRLIAEAFKLRDCPMLVQMIADGDEISVIEFSARMGGGSKYHLIEYLSGVDIMSAYVDRILGGKPTIKPVKRQCYCKMVYLYCYPGVFDYVEGLEELKSKGVIEEFFIYKTKGMSIVRSQTSGDRPAGYLISAESSEELAAKLDYSDSHIRVVSNKGEDIMIHKLLTYQ